MTEELTASLPTAVLVTTDGTVPAPGAPLPDGD
jgi:hypothetical protein